MNELVVNNVAGGQQHIQHIDKRPKAGLWISTFFHSSYSCPPSVVGCWVLPATRKTESSFRVSFIRVELARDALRGFRDHHGNHCFTPPGGFFSQCTQCASEIICFHGSLNTGQRGLVLPMIDRWRSSPSDTHTHTHTA